MPSAAEIALAVVLGPPLWLAGAIFFDLVHYVLHLLLQSRSGLLRALAWPHAVHHRWIDRHLEVHYEEQTRNIWCHIVPEYLTQLVFSAALWLVLPTAWIVVLVALQTTVFLLILRARGLDVNHRPVDWLDAYRPGFLTPPAYHALHHVYPDAYFSAYTKLIDRVVASGTQLRDRRFAFVEAHAGLGSALRLGLGRLGVERIRRFDSLDGVDPGGLDVLVLCDAAASPVVPVEAFIEATRTRRLPPEVWAIRAGAADPTARHYHDDPRVNFRTIVYDGVGDVDAAARRALARIRRGYNFVPTAPWATAWRDWRAFRAIAAQRPPQAPARVRRAALATS